MLHTLTLIITAWVGRLTPQASVAVDTSTFISPSEKRRSTIDRFVLNMPAWWMLKPSENKSLNCLLAEARTCKIIYCIILGLLFGIVFTTQVTSTAVCYHRGSKHCAVTLNCHLIKIVSGTSFNSGHDISTTELVVTF